jgi:large subunit ribosomal protein L24
MKNFHIKRGEDVVVIAGAHKGKTGKVLELLAAKNRARVEGLAMIKRHMKKSEENPNGAIVERGISSPFTSRIARPMLQ